MKAAFRGAPFTLVLALACAQPARAESVLVAGAAASPDSEVVYLGRLAPLPGERLADGFAWSLFADYVGYRYRTGSQRIDASAPGVQAGLSKQYSWRAGALSVGAVASLNHTDLSPDDPGNGSRGWHAGVGPQLQWRGDERQPLASFLLGNWISGRKSYYVKGFAGARLGNGWALGPEASLSGDPSYQIRSLGLALKDVGLGPLRLGFSVGVQDQKGLPKRVYGGLELGWYQP